MNLDLKSVIAKAQIEPNFLIGLLDNPKRTLASFNIEVNEVDQKELDIAMKQCREFITNKLTDLGATVEGEQEPKGYGGWCCNF